MKTTLTKNLIAENYAKLESVVNDFLLKIRNNEVESITTTKDNKIQNETLIKTELVDIKYLDTSHAVVIYEYSATTINSNDEDSTEDAD